MRGLACMPVGVIAAAVLVAACSIAACSNQTTSSPLPPSDGGLAGQDGAIEGQTCSATSSCPAGQHCSFQSPGSCGQPSFNGFCRANPSSCPADCPALCGCDGKAYCNACEANRAGFDVNGDSTCVSGAGDYLAFALYTTPTRFVIFKKDTGRTVCTRLAFVSDGGQPPFPITVANGWRLETAEATDHLEDCALTSDGHVPAPIGTSVAPTRGEGSVAFDADAGSTPCSIRVHVQLGFDVSAAPWANPAEVLVADPLVVNGACQR